MYCCTIRTSATKTSATQWKQVVHACGAAIHKLCEFFKFGSTLVGNFELILAANFKLILTENFGFMPVDKFGVIIVPIFGLIPEDNFGLTPVPFTNVTCATTTKTPVQQI